MGRPRLSENVKVLRGTLEKNKERKSKKPHSLLWKMLIEKAARVGNLTEIDDMILAACAEDYERYMRLSKFVRENGEKYELENEKGEQRIRPEIKIMHDAYNRFYPIFKAFGLTHSLSRIVINNEEAEKEKPEESPFDWKGFKHGKE